MEIRNVRSHKLVSKKPLVCVAEGDYIGAGGIEKLYAFTQKIENGVIHIINAELNDNVKNKIKEILLRNDLNPIQRDRIMRRV